MFCFVCNHANTVLLFKCSAGAKRQREEEPQPEPSTSTSSKRHAPHRPAQKARPSSSSGTRRPVSPPVMVSDDESSRDHSFPRILPKEKSVVTWLHFMNINFIMLKTIL